MPFEGNWNAKRMRIFLGDGRSCRFDSRATHARIFLPNALDSVSLGLYLHEAEFNVLPLIRLLVEKPAANQC